ncbi:MAG: hypothetical protein VX546_15505 [Myxococcota bacterium]|nr:hypothetical protein [Myxococcota bacterium]
MYRLIPIFLALATAAAAGSPAAIPDSGRHRAASSFQEFAVGWMEKSRKLEQTRRGKPAVVVGASEPVVTYRSFGDDFSIELQPTGRPGAPYLGLLRYTEHVYRCGGVATSECSIAATVPVTEIFRFQYGRWNY